MIARTEAVPRAGRAAVVGAVMLVSLLAIPPRLAAIREAGPFVWDDGIHLLEGRWLETGAVALAKSIERFRTERRTGEDVWRLDPELAFLANETQGIPLYFPRPAYAVAVAAALHATGGADWSGALVSAIAGVLTVTLVTALGVRAWGVRSGALAGVALALSGWHVAYSRMAFAESLSVLVATAAVACVIRPEGPLRARRLVCAGVLWGLGCLAQDRLLPITLLPVILAYTRAAPVRGQRAATAARVLVAIGAPIVALQALAELPYYGAMLALAHFQRALPFPTHVERLLRHYAQGAAISGVRPENLPTYPFLYARMLGPGLALALVAGVVAALRTRDRTLRRLVLWLVLPIAPASLTAAGARYAAVTLPAAALLGGWALDPENWPRAVRERLGRTGGWALVGVLVASSIPFAVAPIRWTSGHREAMSVVRDAGLRCVVSTDPYVDAVYLDYDAARVRFPPRSSADLRAAWESGCGMYAVDAIGAVLRQKDRGIEDVLASFESTVGNPIALPNPGAESILFPFEYNFSFPTTLRYLASPERDRAGAIWLYPIGALARPEGDPSAPSPAVPPSP
ncbi:MAG: hypothetical protein U0610_22220 [bacterium]